MESEQRRILGVIPARFASMRLPGKPLTRIGEKTLIRRVWEGAKDSKLLSHLIVATDDTKIVSEVNSFGGQALLTSTDIGTGSERVAIAAKEIGQEVFGGCAPGATKEGLLWQVVVNIQGDMPFITGAVIDGAIRLFLESEGRFAVTTVAIPIWDAAVFHEPSAVKIALSKSQEALYFSRASIPFHRERNEVEARQPLGFQHLGLYVFSPAALAFLLNSPPSSLEKIEQLEQLRLLENGYRIGVFLPANFSDNLALEVNTPEDLEKISKIS